MSTKQSKKIKTELTNVRKRKNKAKLAAQKRWNKNSANNAESCTFLNPTSVSASPSLVPPPDIVDDKLLLSASKRKLDLFKEVNIKDNFSDDENDTTVSMHRIINLHCLNTLFLCFPCPACKQYGLKIKEDPSKKNGMAVHLNFICTDCDEKFGETMSSAPLQQDGPGKASFEVTRRSVMAINEIGLGFSSLKTFAATLGLPTLGKTQYHQHMQVVAKANKQVASTCLDDAAKFVRKAYEEIDTSFKNMEVIDIAVSYDGSWHRRGHTSHHGLGAVIDLMTGLVLDYEVLSTYCQSCTNAKAKFGEDSEDFVEWYECHKTDCAKNWNKSAGAMEVEAAERIWMRSITKHKMRYTTFLGDGDSRAHSNLLSKNIYGNEHPIQKEECLNHVIKRMHTALRKLVDDNKGTVTLGGKGKGKITIPVMKKLALYYRLALVKNKNITDMKNAIWATLFHGISTDEDPHHKHCNPLAISRGEIPGPHSHNIKTPISREVLPHIIDTYKRLSDENLLKRCLHTKTQNQNESLHAQIWRRCYKVVFVGRQKVEAATAAAVSQFNKGASRLLDILEHQNILTGRLEKDFCITKDKIRVDQAQLQATETAKRHRLTNKIHTVQQLGSQHVSEGAQYESGQF